MCYAFLLGASFTHNIYEGVVMAVVNTLKDLMLVGDLAYLVVGKNLTVFTSCDVIGIEVGVAVKMPLLLL